MTVPVLRAVRLSSRDLDGRELLVLGPSLGTSTAMWSACAELLGDEVDIVGWDLPGHGITPAPDPADSFTVADLASAVLNLVDSIAPGAGFHYAGDSLGGATGAELALQAPDRVSSLTMVCSAPVFATPEMWTDRAAKVRELGTPIMIDGSAARWFAPGFIDTHGPVASQLLHALHDTDRFGYAACCEALAGFDLRASFEQIRVPFLAIAGEHDQVCPYADAAWMADHVRGGRAVELPGVAHLAPAEDPAAVSALLRTQLALQEATNE